LAPIIGQNIVGVPLILTYPNAPSLFYTRFKPSFSANPSAPPPRNLPFLLDLLHGFLGLFPYQYRIARETAAHSHATNDIRRAYFVTNKMITLLHTASAMIDVTAFGFEEVDELLMPTRAVKPSRP